MLFLPVPRLGEKNGGKMNILDYIPNGKDNAISRLRLCQMTGLSDREVRSYISNARLETVILNNSDGSGYYRPLLTEKEEVRKYINQELKRMKSIAIGLYVTRSFYEDLEHERL
jgi:hypothetical protein